MYFGQNFRDILRGVTYILVCQQMPLRIPVKGRKDEEDFCQETRRKDEHWHKSMKPDAVLSVFTHILGE